MYFIFLTKYFSFLFDAIGRSLFFFPQPASSFTEHRDAPGVQVPAQIKVTPRRLNTASGWGNHFQWTIDVKTTYAYDLQTISACVLQCRASKQDNSPTRQDWQKNKPSCLSANEVITKESSYYLSLERQLSITSEVYNRETSLANSVTHRRRRGWPTHVCNQTVAAANAILLYNTRVTDSSNILLVPCCSPGDESALRRRLVRRRLPTLTVCKRYSLGCVLSHHPLDNLQQGI